MPRIVPPTVIDIVDYMIWIIWTCLNHTDSKYKNPVFALVIGTEIILQKLISDGGLMFAPGHLDAVQTSKPPPLSYLKSLPTFSGKCWAVYLLVLEKSGSRPRIYIGTGTNTAYGVYKRFQNYEKLRKIPVDVQQAFDNGYTIVHKGLLCWSPIPAAAIRFPVRVLYIMIEAIF
jgi:hypothetical protein